MLYLVYKVPVGLLWEWVANPGQQRSKYNEKSPGVRAWHIYLPYQFAVLAGEKLAKLIRPKTKKSDLPFAATSHLVPDWRSARNDLLWVAPSKQLTNLVEKMVIAMQDFQELTEEITTDTATPGFLTKSATSHFGDCTLLKFFLSIKASPSQAKKAEQGKSSQKKSAS